ncbi:MAG: type II secretion system F family protein [Epsilonproteobacteria bacterium]|jgi:general secretion pathway protein F/type IV pilus assembly protein PilC|nr:type II secretion system F family protein [Campylobacterota bacterium]
MTYRYKGYDEAGKRVRGTVVADTPDAATAVLRERGVFVEKLSEYTPLFTRALPPAVMEALGRNLGLYLKAGIPLPKGLKLLMEGYAPASPAYRFLAELLREIEGGRGFYEALSRQKIYRIPPFYLQTVRVAQTAGTLERVLPELADYVAAQERVRRETAKAFIYPAFIMIIAVGMINFMLVAIIPKIVGMFETTGSKLPTATKITLAVSDFFRYHGVLLLVLLTVVAAAGVWAWRSERFGVVMERWLLKFPFFGKMVAMRELGRFSRVMALLMQSGVPFAVALDNAAKTVTNRYMRGLFTKVAERVVEGRGFTAAVGEVMPPRLIPKDFVNAVALGEQSSYLADSLAALAELYDRQNRDRIDVMLALLEPVLMLVIGGVIGFLVISMLLPIFTINLEG